MHHTASNGPCYICGRTNYTANECRFRDTECHYCKKKGHTTSACRAHPLQKFVKKGQPERKLTKAKYRRTKPQSTRWLEVSDNEVSDTEELQLFNSTRRRSCTYEADIAIEEKTIRMEIDTSTAVSIMSENQQKELFPNAALSTSNMELKIYTGKRMAVVGEWEVQIQYRQQSKTLPLIVVAGDGPSIFGRNWLKHLCRDWQRIGSITTGQTPRSLESPLIKHVAIFKVELGTIQVFKEKLQMKQDAKPRFRRARSVPFVIKEAIELELDRLEASRILKKVTYSDWAAPIIAVPKKDGNIRISRDYKVTVNPELDENQYPLSNPDYLFATLAGGKKYTKLDLSQAYQQLVLDDESHKYLTINTPRIVQLYTHLPFGIASIPAIFQKVMDMVLKGIPNVVCYRDNILVTRADDAAHLRNLAEVLQRLEDHGIQMKMAKCSLMKAEVKYLGHRVDAEGLHTTTDNWKRLCRHQHPRVFRNCVLSWGS